MINQLFRQRRVSIMAVFWELIKAVILGIVEGITEWLPISSTGHLILVDEFLKLEASAEFRDLFLVVVQLGAILSVVVLFWNRIWPFSAKKSKREVRGTFSLWLKIVVACIPTIVIALPFEDAIERLFYRNTITSSITVAAALIVYGVLFIVVENLNRGKAPRIGTLPALDYKTALGIGLFQVLAVIPGTSRSGATILGAILIGTSRTVAAEFTFLLAIPVMFGASFLKLIKFGLHFTGLEIAVLLTGTVVAFFVSMLAIRFLMNFVKKHDFKVFGWYRIVLGVIVLLYFLIRYGL
ncbi:MAG TPA: undecaprenyl-diphosphate phosphatase [Papillibacter sp.]|nr:undecaprenyl-diphosphate phosphatase [Papillibacter sp.]